MRGKSTKPSSAKKKASPPKNKEARRKTLYNLLPGEYDKILAYQGGVCPITLTLPKRTAIDHDHKTGLVRGVIDWRINRALAYFSDDPELLRRAADYLDHPPATDALREAVYGVIGKITKKAKNRRYGPCGAKDPQERKTLTTERNSVHDSPAVTAITRSVPRDHSDVSGKKVLRSSKRNVEAKRPVRSVRKRRKQVN